MEVCVDFSAQGWLMEERRRGRGAAGETTSSKRERSDPSQKIKGFFVELLLDTPILAAQQINKFQVSKNDGGLPQAFLAFVITSCTKIRIIKYIILCRCSTGT